MLPEIYCNEGAERSLLGLALQYPGECLRAVASLPSEAFFLPAHQEIHRALAEMERNGEQVDLVTVDAFLASRQTLAGVGGTAYLMQCVSEGIGPSFMKGHLQIVLECHSRRAQRKLAQEYARMLDSGEDPEETREWLLRGLNDVKGPMETDLISAREAVVRTMVRLEAEQEKDGEPAKRILSGVRDLDCRLGGLTGSIYVAIGARPAVGKSVFAMTYCVNAARQGKRVMLVSLEMDEVDITKRITANLGNLALEKLTGGKMETPDWEAAAAGLAKVAHLPMWISTGADTVEKVRRAAYTLYEQGGIDLIAIDYIQLMGTGKGNMERGNRQEQVAEISRGLRKLSMELKIPVIVLTQLNRASVNSFGGAKKREPTMSEARESGAIEQDANIFMLLHRPEWEEVGGTEEEGLFEALERRGMRMMRVIIEKNRMGTPGRVTLAFDGAHMRFLGIERE